LGGPANCNEPAKVAELLNMQTHDWNIPLLHNLYDESIVQEILAIQVRPVYVRDKLIWTATTDGDYTVKSGYHAIKNAEVTKNQHTTICSYQTSAILWKQLWKLKIEPKVWVFLWSLCHNALPTKANLYHRRMYSLPKPNTGNSRAYFPTLSMDEIYMVALENQLSNRSVGNTET